MTMVNALPLSLPALSVRYLLYLPAGRDSTLNFEFTVLNIFENYLSVHAVLLRVEIERSSWNVLALKSQEE